MVLSKLTLVHATAFSGSVLLSGIKEVPLLGLVEGKREEKSKVNTQSKFVLSGSNAPLAFSKDQSRHFVISPIMVLCLSATTSLSLFNSTQSFITPSSTSPTDRHGSSSLLRVTKRIARQ